ncbi:hypothetical protein SKAU_G00379160 [Synaphobranchus kaupii]|uniref:Uncharacterized protein n=1 Tax=Synaphobranchus kaupii TaxID=118154 RepID=A0A9Q1EDC2_SYNKA|nr:hypothetical protein SKAU_G00379160 [Synaphobranchus kaupii]
MNASGQALEKKTRDRPAVRPCRRNEDPRLGQTEGEGELRLNSAQLLSLAADVNQCQSQQPLISPMNPHYVTALRLLRADSSPTVQKEAGISWAGWGLITTSSND